MNNNSNKSFPLKLIVAMLINAIIIVLILPTIGSCGGNGCPGLMKIFLIGLLALADFILLIWLVIWLVIWASINRNRKP